MNKPAGKALPDTALAGDSTIPKGVTSRRPAASQQGWLWCAAWAVGCLVSTALDPSEVVSQTPSAVSWVREPGATTCISPIELGSRVEQLLGPVLVPSSEAEISVEGRIYAANGGYVALIWVSDAKGRLLGQRRLSETTDNCRSIDDAITFVVAVMLDPNAALAQLPAEFAALPNDRPEAELLAELRSAPPGSRAAGGAPPKPTARAPQQDAAGSDPPSQSQAASAPEARATRLVTLGAGTLLAGWLQPRVAMGLGVAAEAHWTSAFSLRLSSAYWFPQHIAAELVADQVSLHLWQVEAHACGRFLLRHAWALGLCAGPQLGRLTANSTTPEPSTRLWLLDAGFELFGTWSGLALLQVRGALGLHATVLRHRITYLRQSRVTLYQVAPVNVVAKLSAEIHF